MAELTPESRTIRKHYDDLLTAIQDPTLLAASLYSAEIIPRSMLDRIRELPSTSNGTMILLGAVSDQISIKPSTFQNFVAILGHDSTLAHTITTMQDTYSGYTRSKQVLKQTAEIQLKDTFTQNDTARTKVHSTVQANATMIDASVQTEVVHVSEIRDASTQTEVFPTSSVAAKSTQAEPTLSNRQAKERKERAPQREIDFSQARLNWEQVPCAPKPLQGPGTIAVHGSKAYINGKGASTIFEYDSTSNKWLNKIEAPRTDFGLAVVGNCLTLVGGNEQLQATTSESTFEITYSSWFYSLATNTGSYLYKKYCNCVYGTATNSLLSQELLRSTGNSSWTEDFPSMSTARANPVLAATDKYLVVTGGSGICTSIEVMDVDQRQWYTAEKIPSLRCCDLQRLVAHEDTLYAIKAASTNENSLNIFTCSLTTLVNSCSSENAAYKPVLWQKALTWEIPTPHSYNCIVAKLIPLAPQKLGVVVFYEYIHAENGTEGVLQTDVRLFIYDARVDRWDKAPTDLCPYCPTLDYQNSSIAKVSWNKVMVFGASEHPSQICDRVLVGRISQML